MSLYVQWINSIKQHSSSEWLTDNQAKAFETVINNWQGEPFVCLYGASGSGKTFIGHLLEREYGYVYTQDLREVSEGNYEVVLDGQEYNRLMRPLLQSKGWKRIILLTRKLPRDPMPTVHLTLMERDVRQFQNILNRNNIIPTFQCSLKTTDLHQWIRSEAVVRGNTYGAI
ncbi:MAG: hypothetical protein ACYCYO_00420 [Bacilli bacterium]